MPSKKLIGRTKEIEKLDHIYASDEAELVAVYGRRRVGKTFLIRHYFAQKRCPFFQLTGIHKAPLSEQLGEFTKALTQFYSQLDVAIQPATPNTWLDAFAALTEALKLSRKKTVLFFDEFPWLASKKSQLLAAFDYYWNRHWVDNPKVKMIICGSAASWIIENILNNKGGLHNRVTYRLPIKPFSLVETQQYLTSRGVHYDPMQIVQLYLCVGGIPFYLKAVRHGLSAIQNINEMCFQDGALLKEEFQVLFASLFNQADKHESIVKHLAAHRNGLARSVIQAHSGYHGGGLSRVLKELEYAGFIESFQPESGTKGIYYKLIDEYSLFYLNWIAPTKKAQQLVCMTDEFWQVHTTSPAWHAWSGYAFEALCLKHMHWIRKALNIPTNAKATTWHYRSPKGSDIPGAQIDLLFDRPDGMVTLCEIKFSPSPITLDKAMADNLRQKIQTYQHVTKTHKQIIMSLISPYGLAPSTHAEGLIWSQAVLKDLFTK